MSPKIEIYERIQSDQIVRDLSPLETQPDRQTKCTSQYCFPAWHLYPRPSNSVPTLTFKTHIIVPQSYLNSLKTTVTLVSHKLLVIMDVIVTRAVLLRAAVAATAKTKIGSICPTTHTWTLK